MEGLGSTDRYAKKWQILLAVSIGTMMVPLNASIINISLPNIASFFGVSLSVAEWVLTSYFIMFIGLVLFFARFGDFFGHERLFMIGLVGFIGSSVLCSLSPSVGALILFRALQGIAGSMVLSVSMVLVEKSFPTRYLGKAFGIYYLAVGAGLAIGPAIGGVMNSFFGWRSIFLVNVPLGILALVMSYITFEVGKSSEVKWDLPGTVLQFSYLFLVIFALNSVEQADYLGAFLAGVLAVLLFALFIRAELRAESPMMELKFFKNKVFSAFNVCLHFNYICVYMLLFALPFYLQKVLHVGTGTSGLILTASPIVMMVMAPVSGFISDRVGSRIPVFAGSIICAAALFAMTGLTTTSTPITIFCNLAVFGLGTALFLSPANKTLMSALPEENVGMASGVIATIRDMGMVFAVCYGGLLIHSAIPAQMMLPDQIYGTAAQLLTEGIHRVMIFCATLSIAMALLSLTGMKNRKQTVMHYEDLALKKTVSLEKRVSGAVNHILGGNER